MITQEIIFLFYGSITKFHPFCTSTKFCNYLIINQNLNINHSYLLGKRQLKNFRPSKLSLCLNHEKSSDLTQMWLESIEMPDTRPFFYLYIWMSQLIGMILKNIKVHQKILSKTSKLNFHTIQCYYYITLNFQIFLLTDHNETFCVSILIMYRHFQTRIE